MSYFDQLMKQAKANDAKMLGGSSGGSVTPTGRTAGKAATASPVSNNFSQLMRQARANDNRRVAGTQFGYGNIDLTSRPVFRNDDGSISTVDSSSYNIDGKEVLLPSVWMKDGKAYHSRSADEIVQHYRDTGEHLGVFDTPELADEYAQALHEAQEKQYAEKQDKKRKKDAEDQIRNSISYDEFAEQYRSAVNPNAGAGEMLAMYEKFIEDSAPKPTVRYKGVEMTADDILTYVEQTAKRLGVEPLPDKDILTSFDEMYEQQHGTTDNPATEDRKQPTEQGTSGTEGQTNNLREFELAATKADLARARSALQLAKRKGSITDRKNLQAEIKELEKTLHELEAPSGKKGKDGFSAGKLAAGMVEKGITTAARGISSTLSWLESALFAPAEALTGFDDLQEQHGLFYNWNKGIEEERNTAYARAEENTKKGGKAAAIADELGTMAVAAVPQAVAAFMSAGASLGLSGAQGLEATALAAKQSPTILAALRGAVTKLADNPTYWTSFLQTAGTSYEQAKADGASEGRASLFALANGLANAAVEVGGGLETLPAELQNGPITFKRWLKSASEEGSEEVWQGIIERGFQNATYGKDNPLVSMSDENAVLNPVTSAKEYTAGTAVGGILGGGQIALGKAVSGASKIASQTEQLDAVTTALMDIDMGSGQHMNLKTAKQKADIIQRCLNGEAITPADVNKLNLTQAPVRELFEQFLGDTLPTDYNKLSATEQVAAVQRMAKAAQESTDAAAETALPATQEAAEGNFTPASEMPAQAVQEGVQIVGSVAENAAPKTETAHNPISPAQDAGLSDHPIPGSSSQSLGQTATQEDSNILYDVEELVKDHGKKYIKEHGEDAYASAVVAAAENGDVKANAVGDLYAPRAEDHIDNRNRHDVGNRSVKAFQFQNPEIHPYYEKVAAVLLDELSTVQKGGELVRTGKNSDLGGEEYTRLRRGASEAISELRDGYGFSYADIEKALNAIIEDRGQENIAVAKRLELKIDEMLENDYRSAWGNLSEFIDLDAYRNAKASIRGAQEQTSGPSYAAGSFEAYLAENRLALESGEASEAELRAEWEAARSETLPQRNDSLGSARAAFTPEQAQSNDSSTASALNETERGMEGLRQEDAQHQKLTNAESIAKARERLDFDYEGEVNDLPNIRDWGAVEMDMAQIILRNKVSEARKSGDYSDVIAWKKLIDERKSLSGQALQANVKYAGDTASLVSTAAETLEGSKLPKEKRAEVLRTIGAQADKLNSISTGDAVSLAELVKENSTIRRTNSLLKNELSKPLEALIDGDTADHLRIVAQAQLESMASDHVKRSAGERVRSLRAMSMLSNLATVTRNLVSNNVFDPVDAIAGNVGVPLDMLLSRYTGTRSTALDGSWTSKVKRQASVEAMARSTIEVALDVDTDSGGGANRYGQSSKRTFKMSGSPLERFLSTWSKWQGYLLNTTDEFQKGGIAAETQRGIDSLKAQGKITDDTLDTAGKDMAKYRTFQDDTKLSRGVRMAHDAGNAVLGTKDGSFGLGDVVIPFGKVPSNLVARAWDYSPAGIGKGLYDLAVVLRDARNGTLTAAQQAQAVREVGRGVTGAALIAGFAYLAEQGLLRVVDNGEDKDKAALDAAEGKSGLQLNLDAISRHLKGESAAWQKGDALMSVGFLDPISAQMMIGALVAEDAKDGELTAEEYAKSTVYGTLQSILDLPGMSTIEGMINAYKYSDEETAGGRLKDAALDTAADLPISFIPNALKAVARGTDNTYRNLYSKEGVVPQALDAVAGAIPVAREKLPEVVDPFGRTKTYTNADLLNFLNATVLPGAVNFNKQDDLSAELERLYTATGAAGIYPNKSAPQTVKVNGEEVALTAKQQEQYQRTYGSTAHDLMDDMRKSTVYRKASDTDKVKYLSKCLSYAATAAKETVLHKETDGFYVDARDAKKLFGISTSDYLMAKASTAGITENAKDKKGEGIENSKSLLLMQAIYKTGITAGMDDRKRKELFQSLGVNKTTCGYSEKIVERKLRAMERKYGLELVA